MELDKDPAMKMMEGFEGSPAESVQILVRSSEVTIFGQLMTVKKNKWGGR